MNPDKLDGVYLKTEVVSQTDSSPGFPHANSGNYNSSPLETAVITGVFLAVAVILTVIIIKFCSTFFSKKREYDKK